MFLNILHYKRQNMAKQYQYEYKFIRVKTGPNGSNFVKMGSNGAKQMRPYWDEWGQTLRNGVNRPNR